MTTGFFRLRVLLIGATGNFGKRLARRLHIEPGVEMVLAGRSLPTLEKLSGELGAEFVVVDRDRLTGEQLTELAVDVLIDASGPFQLTQTGAVHAAIDAAIHYIDLADAREFVSSITQFDKAAREAGIAVITGASSSPALSHAVVDHLTAGWRQIDSLCATISPSNRQAVGLSVVKAMLSMAGQRLSVFDKGSWVDAVAWSQTRLLYLDGLDTRCASLVSTPDLDLFVSRYAPRESARFEAALGLPFMHFLLVCLAKLVQFGVVSSLLPLSKPLHWIANHLWRFGKDCGAMRVRVTGLDDNSEATTAQWQLTATGNTGPNVPILACVALLRKMRDGELSFTGASACVGLLQLCDFEKDLHSLGITTVQSQQPSEQ
ncbi:MAG: saccharopine dehydrogenase NADP-binding domain-containing protein [Granulosicoccus sp.]